MSTVVPSQQDLYDVVQNEAQARNPNLTDYTEGSMNDVTTGAWSVGGQELVKVVLDLFAKTFFSTANGPEVTDGPDDLQTLAVDHFGDSFARPLATPAVGTVTFARPNTNAGNVDIPAGTVVKTATDSSGNQLRFATLIDETLTGLTINASVQAVSGEEGPQGNVNPDTVVQIESALTDSSITVNNAAAFDGGTPVADDATYREFIRNQIETLRGATAAAIEAAAETVPGVVTASAIEALLTVIQWDIGTSMPIGSPFYMPQAQLYIADANGTASPQLLAAVNAAIQFVRACGVRVQLFAATALSLNWTISITLNPSGPNYAVLSSDSTLLTQWMSQYIVGIPIGSNFVRSLAVAAFMAEWGPLGSNDITAMTIDAPTGDVAATATQKLIPGTMAVS